MAVPSQFRLRAPSAATGSSRPLRARSVPGVVGGNAVDRHGVPFRRPSAGSTARARRTAARHHVRGAAGAGNRQLARIHRHGVLVDQPLRGMRVRLHLLLRPVRAPLRRGARLGRRPHHRTGLRRPRQPGGPRAVRAPHLRQGPQYGPRRARSRSRAGAAPHDPRRHAEPGRRYGHRSVSTRGTAVPDHPRDPRQALRRAGSAHRRHHQEPAGDPRHRPAGPARIATWSRSTSHSSARIPRSSTASKLALRCRTPGCARLAGWQPPGSEPD